MIGRIISIAFVLCAPGIVGVQVPNPGNSGSDANTSVVKQTQPPDSPPLPPDVRTPDSPPGDASASGNAVTRTLKKLAPNCVNAIFHACWSSPPQKPEPPQTDERKGAASREVGEFYLEHGNYRAAESRFREALQFKPNDARAMFDLGRSLEGTNKIQEAIAEYKSCVDSQPAGAYAERSRKAIDRLTAQSSNRPR